MIALPSLRWSNVVCTPRSIVGGLLVVSFFVGACTPRVRDEIDQRRASRDAGAGDSDASADAGSDASMDADVDASVPSEAGAPCVSGTACSDGLACNGLERCAPMEAGADANGCVAGVAPVCQAPLTCSDAIGGCACGGVAACRVGARCDAANSVCYGDYASWPVPTSIRGGLPTSSQYMTNGGSVMDVVTGLVWQQTNGPKLYSWSEAVTYCNDLTLDGASDWRLPTVVEWSTLLQPAAGGTTYSLSYYFSTTETRQYWSATERYGQTGLVWSVLSGSSTFVDSQGKTGSVPALVRCVRGSGSRTTASPRFATVGGVVTDSATGLAWTRASSNVALSSYASNCASLVLGGFDDWRLPELGEVASLFDPSVGRVTSAPFPDLAQPASNNLWIETGGTVAAPDAKISLSALTVTAAASGDTAMLLCVR